MGTMFIVPLFFVQQSNLDIQCLGYYKSYVHSQTYRHLSHSLIDVVN